MTYAFKGQMVLYRLTEAEAQATNRRREHAQQNLEKMREERPGFQAHIGTYVETGVSVPMIVTVVWPSAVNGQAFLDGNDSLWVKTVTEGEEPGQWQPIMHG